MSTQMFRNYNRNFEAEKARKRETRNLRIGLVVIVLVFVGLFHFWAWQDSSIDMDNLVRHEKKITQQINEDRELSLQKEEAIHAEFAE